MAKGKNKPALYELMSDRPRAPMFGSNPARRHPAPPPEFEEGEDTILGISPGRVIRLPVGVVFLIAFVVLAGVFAAYQVGHHLGRAGAFAEVDGTGGSRSGGGMVDPLNDPEDPMQTPRAGGARAPDDADGTDGPVARSAEPDAPPALVIVDSDADDPRIPGLNYHVLTYVPREEAERAARFLVERGVSVARLRVDSGGRAELVALRGFERPKSSDAARRYQSQIRRLGREYRAEGGAVDFSSSYWRRYE